MKMYFEPWNKEDNDVLTAKLASRFASLAGPYSETLQKSIDEGDTASLVSLGIDYNRFSSPLEVYATRQCLALYQKRDDLNLSGIDRKEVAYQKFVESEQACKLTNERIRQSRTAVIDSGVASVLFTAQQKISKILGDVPSLESLQLAYGPGANTNVRKTTSARWKLSAKPACSLNMASTVCSVLAELPEYCKLHRFSEDESFWRVDVAIEPGELMFVPKNAKTDRSIIVEPSLNSLVQKGFGTYLKRRLFYAGVNLYDQALNQRRAQKGSIDGSLATIDLSSASDTISRELVAELLPLDWYIALRDVTTSEVRCKRKGGDVQFNLEKFSSMGNGFTFELESLIFYALTKAACQIAGVKSDVTVYGDDIICPPAVLPLLEKVFDFCGFTINTGKSYSEGPFRESCGADFYEGVNVRPFFQKTTWSYGTVAAFHNFLVNTGWGWIVPNEIENLVKVFPDPYLNYGPAGYGDGHLVSHDLSLKPYGRDRGWSGYVFETFIKKTAKVKTRCKGDFILPVYSVYMRMSEAESFNPYAVRGERGEKRISVYTLGRF